MLKKEVEQVYAIATEIAEKKIKEALSGLPDAAVVAEKKINEILATLPKPEVIIKEVVVEKIVEKEPQPKRKAKDFETTTKRK